MSISIADITLDTSLTAAEKQSLTKFRTLVETMLENQNPPGNDWKNLSMFHLCESVGVDLSALPKEGQMLSALWVIVLRGIRKYITDADMKFQTFEDFEEAYKDSFPRDDESELRKLWQAANWMHILFNLIPAKKNKGLVMLVVPRFIEGWHVKYVTGSGQTHFTANRVKVFETEGETKAAHRGKLKVKPPKKKGGLNGQRQTSDGSDDTMSSTAIMTATYTLQNRDLSVHTGDLPVTSSSVRKRKVTHHQHSSTLNASKRESSVDSDTSAAAAAETMRRSKRAKTAAANDRARMPPPPIPGRCTTDVLRSASNEECREAYKEFQANGLQRDETSLLIPDLLRSDSWVNSNNTNNINGNNAAAMGMNALINMSHSINNSNSMNMIPAPAQAERNITWGEIPVTNSTNNASTVPSYSSNPYGNGMSSLSNLGSISLGSVFMNNLSTMPVMMRPEGSEGNSVFDGNSPPSVMHNHNNMNNNSNIFGPEKLADVFGGFLPPGFQMSLQQPSTSSMAQDHPNMGSPNKMAFA